MQPFRSMDTPGGVANKTDDDFESRKASVQQKVEEIKARIQLKQLARKRYDKHVKNNPPTIATTDYIKWDIWCPEDDEDELVANCTPDSSQLRAMEKDINDRHARCGQFLACARSLVLACIMTRAMQDGEGPATGRAMPPSWD